MITQDDIDAFKDNEPTEQEIYIQKLEQLLKDNLSKSSYSGEIYCHWVEGSSWMDPDGILLKLII